MGLAPPLTRASDRRLAARAARRNDRPRPRGEPILPRPARLAGRRRSPGSRTSRVCRSPTAADLARQRSAAAGAVAERHRARRHARDLGHQRAAEAAPFHPRRPRIDRRLLPSRHGAVRPAGRPRGDRLSRPPSRRRRRGARDRAAPSRRRFPQPRRRRSIRRRSPPGCETSEPDVVAGPPVPLLAAARVAANDGGAPIRARAVAAELRPRRRRASRARSRRPGAREVFRHWGMTETGYGGAVDCAFHCGCHLREDELLVEVVDPATGAPAPAGALGEVVVSTLRRRGAPLLRYRTGDLARLIEAPCSCGSALRRLDGFAGRVGAGAPLPSGGELTLPRLDEALFAVEAVSDFAAVVEAERAGDAGAVDRRAGAASRRRDARGRARAARRRPRRRRGAAGRRPRRRCRIRRCRGVFVPAPSAG